MLAQTNIYLLNITKASRNRHSSEGGNLAHDGKDTCLFIMMVL
jgi:hypothetical protein